MADGQRGSAALLVLAGGGLAMLIALVLVVTIADLVVSRGQAQLAADAAALAAMADEVQPGWDPPGELRAGARRASQTGHMAAEALARANGGELLECCGGVTARRDVEVGVEPRSLLLRWVVPQVRARAAAALEPVGSPVRGLRAVDVASTATGDRVWPVDGPVSSGFGTRVHPMSGTARMHAGLDLAVPAGTPVRAAAAGQIVHDGAMGGYGLTVDIAHGDGTVTRYAHQSRVLVMVGQSVAAGQVIGLAGSTGASTGPHLHFEVRTPAGAIDPRAWLPAASQ
jgi:murein DD-endopeptidase MepM/ murein hydrolase activator NlpD